MGLTLKGENDTLIDNKQLIALLKFVQKQMRDVEPDVEKKFDKLIKKVEKAMGTFDKSRTTYEEYNKVVAVAEALAPKIQVENKKAIKQAAKAGKQEDTKPSGKIEYKVINTTDAGSCSAAAAKLNITSALNRDVKKYQTKKIDKGHLGCLYESNLDTSGDHPSLFFKYISTPKGEDGDVDLVLVAIAVHGDKNKYYEVNKSGKTTKVKISAMKKL